MLLTLYSFYFHQPSAKKIMSFDSDYVLVLHDDFLSLDVSTPSLLDISMHLDDYDETKWGHTLPLVSLRKSPLLRSRKSNTKDPLSELATKDNRMIIPSMSFTSYEVDKVNLYNGKKL